MYCITVFNDLQLKQCGIHMRRTDDKTRLYHPVDLDGCLKLHVCKIIVYSSTDFLYLNHPQFTSVPTGTPRHIYATELNTTVFDLHWEPPLYEERNGQITGYIVRISTDFHEDVRSTVTEHTTLTIEGLMPHTMYTVVIAAQTAVGNGPFSAVVNFQTPEDG